MATVQNTYTGDGSTVLYSFTFPYILETDIKVTLDGTVTTAYSLANATQIQFTTAPGSGVAIRIYRDTNIDGLLGTFFPGSAIKAEDLNDNFTQNNYASQESKFDAATAITTANSATTTANTAATNAATAVSTANTAASDAASAVTTANTANTNASAAVSTANTASAAASTAETNAATALSTANTTASSFATLEANVYDATELDGGQLDTRYYTETELDGGQLDNRYYTETELDAGQLDNRYYTENELNAGQLDNRYYTEAEADARFFHANTETIDSNETWTNSDSYIATTAAIEARIVSLVDDVGGFIPITTHVRFPESNPDPNNDEGTVVSIADVSALTHSGGTSGNASTAGGTQVTITGIPTTLSSPIGSGGMLVVTTTTTHAYTFHRLTPDVDDVVTVSNISSDVSTVAGISANVTSVANNNTDVTTVATNISGVNTTATNISAILAAPTEASNAASSASAAATSATNAANSATAAASSATSAATSASSAANSASAINTLSYLKDFGLITDTAGTVSDYGSLV